ncbi:hypothetical protein VTJ04DRAFT_4122 [Mycothermus thermophilus]|uniref:uncharacterized protein n=1 Tax=Humicola insolens TaxID=85995 RepID=UPI003743F06C
MRLPTIFSLAAALPSILGAEAAVAPKNLKVIGASVLGSGCPYGSADVWADTSNTAIEVRLKDYVVRTGPNTQAADWRKNCKITLNLQYDPGFSLATTTTNLHGYALIPSGVTGQCSTTVDFTGVPGQSEYSVTLKGARSGAFSLQANPDIVQWSPCGGSTAILNINNQCWISPTEKQAIIAVDRISSRLTVRIALEWKQC